MNGIHEVAGSIPAWSTNLHSDLNSLQVVNGH